ncbi:MAG: 50S ribosomal protein L28 [Candidatus Omnitrophota bacterium]
MSRVCVICHKKPSAGRRIKRRGLAKKKGGVGRKITGITKRFFYPNLQKVRVLIHGAYQRVYVCTKCLKAGKVEKA